MRLLAHWLPQRPLNIFKHSSHHENTSDLRTFTHLEDSGCDSHPDLVSHYAVFCDALLLILSYVTCARSSMGPLPTVTHSRRRGLAAKSVQPGSFGIRFLQPQEQSLFRVLHSRASRLSLSLHLVVDASLYSSQSLSRLSRINSASAACTNVVPSKSLVLRLISKHHTLQS